MSYRALFRVLSLASLLIAAFASASSAADWKVTQMSGQVYVQQGSSVQLASLSAGLVLREGATVVTKKNGRALLVRGEQTMIVAPNSTVTLPGGSSAFTRVVEKLGQVEYNVDHRKVRHFEVETPYLAALVKGTRFQVRVLKNGASVTVLRGVVEVTDLRTGEKADVLAGQKAVVGATTGLTISGSGTVSPIKQGKPKTNKTKQAFYKEGNRIGGARDGSTTSGDSRSASAEADGDASAGQGTPSRGGTRSGSNGGGISASAGDGDATASVGSDGVSVSVGDGGATASVGSDGVSVSVGDGGAAASVGSDGMSVSVGDGGISASVGGGAASVSVGGGGLGASVGGLGVNVR